MKLGMINMERCFNNLYKTVLKEYFNTIGSSYKELKLKEKRSIIHRQSQRFFEMNFPKFDALSEKKIESAQYLPQQIGLDHISPREGSDSIGLGEHAPEDMSFSRSNNQMAMLFDTKSNVIKTFDHRKVWVTTRGQPCTSIEKESI